MENGMSGMNSEQTVAGVDMGHLSNAMSTLVLGRCRNGGIPVPMQQTLQNPIVLRYYNQDLPPATNLSQQGPPSQAGGPPISGTPDVMYLSEICARCDEIIHAEAKVQSTSDSVDLLLPRSLNLSASKNLNDLVFADIAKAINAFNEAAAALKVLRDQAQTVQYCYYCRLHRYIK